MDEAGGDKVLLDALNDLDINMETRDGLKAFLFARVPRPHL